MSAYFSVFTWVYSSSLAAMWSLINPSLAPILVGRMDLLVKAGELAIPLSTSSDAVRLADENDGWMVGDGEKPGIPNASRDPSSTLDSVARMKIIVA